MSHTPKIPGINVFDSLTMGGNVKMVGLPTADPEEQDKLWNDNGGIKISNGPTETTEPETPTEQNLSITTSTTEDSLLSSTPTNPTGEVTINFATDTNNLYIYDGEDWYIYDDVFLTDATSTEAEILASTPTNPTNLSTVKYATDTNDLYVYYNNAWHIYFND